MPLRTRLFLAFGSLVILLVVAQWWWVRGLTRDLSAELDQVAITVGRSIAAILIEDIDIESEDLEVSHQSLETCEGKSCRPETVVIKKIQRQGGGEEVLQERVHRIIHSDSEAQIEAHVETHGPEGLALHLEKADGEPFLRLSGHRLPIPRERFQAKIASFSRRLLLGSLGFLVIGLVISAFVAHRVSSPLRQLSVAARQVGSGSLGFQVDVPGSGEVALAVRAFNQMSGRLAELDALHRELDARRHLGEIGEIARGLAHSLRNPLNALGLSVDELATRSPNDVEVADLAESSRRQIRRIDRSIRSFLALASQSGGAVQDVDLGELVQDVCLEALQDAPGQVRLEVDAEPGRFGLWAVEPELRAVIQALVVNAIEVSSPSDVVRVSLQQSSGGARLVVEDQGSGLSEAVREKLFTPHLTTKPNGSGMGLFLAHRIATNRYRGSLTLHDREPVGTRVVLELGSRREESAKRT